MSTYCVRGIYITWNELRLSIGKEQADNVLGLMLKGAEQLDNKEFDVSVDDLIDATDAVAADWNNSSEEMRITFIRVAYWLLKCKNVRTDHSLPQSLS
jgi:hypothetical protein